MLTLQTEFSFIAQNIAMPNQFAASVLAGTHDEQGFTRKGAKAYQLVTSLLEKITVKQADLIPLLLKARANPHLLSDKDVSALGLLFDGGLTTLGKAVLSEFEELAFVLDLQLA